MSDSTGMIAIKMSGEPSHLYGRVDVGYAFKSTKLTREGEGDGDGPETREQTINNHGARISADLFLGFKDTGEEEGKGRVKAALSFVNPHVDTVIGNAGHYTRLYIDLGPKGFMDGEVFGIHRGAIQLGIAVRGEQTEIKPSEGEDVSTGGWNIVFPLGFGIGYGRFLIKDQLDLMIELSPSFKMANEVEASVRPYVNYREGGGIIDAFDIFGSYVKEFGKIGPNTRVNNDVFLMGARVEF